METNKDDIVTQLYALRAGLSAISMESDKVKHCEKTIESNKIDLENNAQRLSIHESSISEAERERAKCAKEYNALDKQLKNLNIAFGKGISLAFNKSSKHFLIPGIPAVVLLGFSAFIIYFGTFKDFPIPFEYCKIIITFTAPIGGVLLIIAVAIALVLAKKHKALEQIRVTEELKTKISQKQKEIDGISANIERMEHSKSDLAIDVNDKKAMIDKNIRKLNSDIDIIVNKVSVYNTALEQQYGKLIMPVDWRDVDLCIYYLQTGRADSIKECLQLVDTQRRHDELVGAIEAAAARISNEINTGFALLGTTVVTCCNALSSRINALGTQLYNQHAEQLAAMQNIEKQNNQLISEVQLGNALRAKSNVTGEQLMNDYKYVQRRNGINI